MKDALGRLVNILVGATATLNIILWVFLAFNNSNQFEWKFLLGWPIGGCIILLVGCMINYVIFGKFRAFNAKYE